MNMGSATVDKTAALVVTEVLLLVRQNQFFKRWIACFKTSIREKEKKKVELEERKLKKLYLLEI